MVKKLHFFIKKHFVKLSIFYLFSLSSVSYSQCAGANASVTICNIQDPANRNINLFSLLGGTPVAGGTWVDNSKSSENDVLNGILDAQAVRNSGVYTYTYTVNSAGCTNNIATVTLIIGPYTGVPSPNVSACNDMVSFNLFSAFDGTQLPPQQNGTWTADTTQESLLGSSINPSVLGVGTYFYTYTIPAVGTCAEQKANISVSVFRKPISGISTNLNVCSTDNLTLHNNLNLNDRLTGQDAGGTWEEVSGTNELANLSDNRIDVENIYNTLGAGTYNFVYTVLSNNPICTNSQTTFRVVIEDPIDFTGASLTVNSDICEDAIATATYTVVLRKGVKDVPNGNYDVSYSLFDGNTTKNLTANGNFTNGNFTFNINRTNFPAVGNYTLTIVNIENKASSGICNPIIGTISDVLSIFPLPNIDNATLKIDPICRGFDAEVEISGNTNLTDGNYRIEYSLSGDNVASNQPQTFTVVNKVAKFSIPASLLTNAGENTVFSINSIVNLTTGCVNKVNLSKAFVINASPDVSRISVSINNECLEGDTVVKLFGLDNIKDITLEYSVSGANTASNQIANAVVNSGEANFIIPMSILQNQGTTNFVLTSVMSSSSSCIETVTDNNTASFTLENCFIFIPDGFSPNNDGTNDTFGVPKIEFTYPDFSLEIFNRYGSLLFKGNKDKPRWDGRNSDYKIGIDGVAPNGVYFYVLHFNKGNKQPVQGRLYLNR